MKTTLTVLVAVLSSIAALHAGDALRIEPWLVLGPAAHPLPAFHAESRGGFDLEALLAARNLPVGPLKPVAGERLDWFDGAPLRWTEANARRGKLALARLSNDDAAVAWAATYLDVGRFAEVAIEITGSHPRRAWLDGEDLATGGLKQKDDTVEAKSVKLTPGKHLLLVRTVRDPERDAAWFVGARLKPSEDDEPRVEFSTNPRRSVELRDILDPPRIVSVAPSPDGTQFALGVRATVVGSHDSETWIEIRDATDGRITRSWFETERVSQISWSPDGRYLSYVVAGTNDEDKSAPSLYLVDLRTRKTETLLEEIEGLTGYAWVPGGKSVLYATTVKAEKDKRGVKRLEGVMDRWANHRDKQYLHVVTVPDGTRRVLTAGALTTEAAATSPDGRRMLFTRQVEHLERRPYGYTELWEMDLKTLVSRKLRDFRWFNAATYSPDGSRLLIGTQASEFGDAGVDLPVGAITNSYDGQLFIWNPATDAVESITRDFDPAVRSADWSVHDGKIYLVAEQADRARVFRYDAGARSFTVLETDFEHVTRLAVARNTPVAVAVGSSPWGAESLTVLNLARGTARALPHPNEPWFADVDGGSVEPWDFTASHGRTIPGRVYLPPDFDRERRYPAIVYYYGGTSPTNRGFGGRYPKEWWAANGYVVYVLQPSGATGFGQAAAARHVNDWGKVTSEEILEGTRKFLEAHPFVDPARVGCIGASYGGFMTMLLSTKTDLFAAAVSHAGISSIGSYWGEGYWGYAYNSVSAAESFPWNRKDIYVDQSPLFRADQAQVPILLTHGAADTNVPVGESDAFYIALKLLNRTVEYVQIDGQDHWIMDHEKRTVWSQTILAWFDRWLKEQPEWWDDLYPDARKEPS